MQFLALQQRLQIEVENEKRISRHAPWLIDPDNSQVYKFWLAFISSALLFELFCIPLVLIWPGKRDEYDNMMWFCDSIWILNIAADFITIRYSIVSRDSLDIAIDYMKTEFVFDFIATFPIMIANHSRKLIFLRFFHIANLRKANSLLGTALEIILPYNRIARG